MPRSPVPDPALAAVLRRLREDCGMTQEALAYKAKITTGTLSKIELGQASPAWVTVRSILDALDVSLTELAAAIESER